MLLFSRAEEDGFIKSQSHTETDVRSSTRTASHTVLASRPLVGLRAMEMLCPAVLAHLSDVRVGLFFPRSHRLLQLHVIPQGNNTLKITQYTRGIHQSKVCTFLVFAINP